MYLTFTLWSTGSREGRGVPKRHGGASGVNIAETYVNGINPSARLHWDTKAIPVCDDSTITCGAQR